MMMSKPEEEKAANGEKLVPPAPLKTQAAAESVKDLERRLQAMSQAETKAPAPKPAPPTKTVPKPATAAAPAAGGKNALLARIMAAQERAKAPAAAAPTMAAPPAAASAAPSSFDFMSVPPPPAFDATSLPPPPPPAQEAPPPAFDAFSLPPPTSEPSSATAAAATGANLMWDPMAPAPPPTTESEPWTPQPPPSAPSAPAFEDLLGFETTQPLAPPPPPPPQEQQQQQQQQGGGLDDDALQAILAMEGLSMEEKQAMIEEQERILASIEKNKKSSQVNAADAFVNRSHAAAVQAIGGRGGSRSQQQQQHQQKQERTVDIGNGTQVALRGQEQTQKAIADGTAVLAQCLSCENWMQVTGSATLMFCPTCQTVSPVLHADDDAAAAQMKADMELAQKLQNEEYTAAERQEARQRTQQAKKKTNTTAAASSSSTSSWWDYLGFGSSATAATGVAASPPPSFAQKPPERGDMGMSRPPGSASRRTLEPVQTGEESIGRAPSYEENGPLLGAGGGAAVVAQKQSLFACVGDSITSAATSMANALAQDEEGNVHGVDSSGLLAVTQVGRDTQYQNMDDGRM